MSERRRELLDVAHAALGHGRTRLSAQDIEHLLDPGLPEGTEPPQIGSADADRGGADGERFHHISAASKATVDQHRDATIHSLYDFRQRIDRGASAVFATPTVVRHDDAINDAAVGGKPRVFVRQDALEHDLHTGGVAQSPHELPSHVGGQQVGDAGGGNIDAGEIRLAACRSVRAAGLMTVAADAGVLAAQA